MLIEIRNLRKEYPAAVPLKNVSTDIRGGDVIAVIGPSGAGKSTFLRCINLLEKPTGGSIRIDGEEILDPSCDVSRIRRRIGMVFQSFNLFGHLTVIENIMLPQIDLLGKSRQEAFDRGMGLLRRVGLSDTYLRYPDEMSGGQKQRAAIARTLAMDPEMILFDEPTSALDPAMVGEVLAVIRTLAREGKTMMIVTHEMSFARAVANRVFYLDDGGICEEGTPEEIFEHPRKELTRRFIRQIRVLEIAAEGSSFDFPGAYGLIDDFCTRNRIPEGTWMKLQTVFEELVQQIMMPHMPGGILFTVQYYHAEERAEITVDYEGKALDPGKTENKLSYVLLMNAVSELRHKALAGGRYQNRIEIRL